MNRLIAEKSESAGRCVLGQRADPRRGAAPAEACPHPIARPSAEGIAEQFRDPQGHWTGFSARARMLIVDQGLKDKPVSIEAYTDPRFNGKAVIANPLFGTTTAHMAALFTVWGDDRAKAFLDAMRRNGVHISSSNGESADQVAAGAFQFALVDSDDVL